MTKEEKLKYIRERTPIADRYEQLAEELVEAAHAAMKMERLLRGVSPSPVSIHDADLALEAEYGDVLAVMDVIGFSDTCSKLCAESKVDRWHKRLSETETKNENG